MGRIITQVVIPGPSGQPTDVFVNTWQFSKATAGVDSAAVVDIADALDAFYAPLFNYYPTSLGTPTYKLYDADEAKPRTPQEIEGGWSPNGSATPMPREVAVCLSFYAAKNTPSTRGRVYLGPLVTSAVGTPERPVVPVAMRTAILDSVDAMVTELRTNSVEDIKWSIWSPTQQTLNDVQNAWVDEAHDTVRSRGIEPSARSTRVVTQ